MKSLLKRLTPKSRGFTIIEVTIVLAIAALIITFIFIAVQNAEKSSRDAARKQAVQQLAGALEQWAQNHNGELPALDHDTGVSYLGNEELDTTSLFCQQNYLPNNCKDFKDPLTNKIYHFQNGGAFTTNPTSHIVCTNPPGGDLPTAQHSASINVIYNDSRTYSISICLEAGQYNYQP